MNISEANKALLNETNMGSEEKRGTKPRISDSELVKRVSKWYGNMPKIGKDMEKDGAVLVCANPIRFSLNGKLFDGDGNEIAAPK